jgi:hypothetical protein
MQSFLEIVWNGLPNKERVKEIKMEQRCPVSKQNQGSVKYSRLIISQLYRRRPSKI